MAAEGVKASRPVGQVYLPRLLRVQVSELAPAHLRGSYQGMQQMWWGAAFCIRLWASGERRGGVGLGLLSGEAT